MQVKLNPAILYLASLLKTDKQKSLKVHKILMGVWVRILADGFGFKCKK